jgi:hypothetical protein
MNSKRPWIVAGAATIALAGFGAAVASASDSSPVRDPQLAPVVQQHDTGSAQPGTTAADNSPESADSPAASPVDTANTADSPN